MIEHRPDPPDEAHEDYEAFLTAHLTAMTRTADGHYKVPSREEVAEGIKEHVENTGYWDEDKGEEWNPPVLPEDEPEP